MAMGLGSVPANWTAGALRVCQTHVQHLGELPRQAGRGNVKAAIAHSVFPKMVRSPRLDLLAVRGHLSVGCR